MRPHPGLVSSTPPRGQCISEDGSLVLPLKVLPCSVGPCQRTRTTHTSALQPAPLHAWLHLSLSNAAACQEPGFQPDIHGPRTEVELSGNWKETPMHFCSLLRKFPKLRGSPGCWPGSLDTKLYSRGPLRSALPESPPATPAGSSLLCVFLP